MHRRWLVIVALASLAGCASPQGPEVVAISASDYDLAFDSALEALRGVGMHAELIDRRSGIVETEYRTAGTILEPWRTDSSTAAIAFESTVNHERRKARLEFTPVRFDEAPAAEAPLTGPDLVGESIEVTDLTQYDGRIELRAWVHLERSTVVGRRRGDWTRRSSTMAIDPDSGLGPAQRFWTPVARDEELERRLLRDIQEALAQHAEAAEAPKG